MKKELICHSTYIAGAGAVLGDTHCVVSIVCEKAGDTGRNKAIHVCPGLFAAHKNLVGAKLGNPNHGKTKLVHQNIREKKAL